MEIIFIFLLLVMSVAMLICAAILAERLGRNVGVFVILALFTTPLFVFLLLICLGETEHQRKNRVKDEERWRQEVRNSLTNQ